MLVSVSDSPGRRRWHTEVVRILLLNGADPGQSRYTYDSWDKLLSSARQNQHTDIETLLLHAMAQRFNYRPEFDLLINAIISRDIVSVQDVVSQQPELIAASDSLGNNALHWSVITCQLNLNRLDSGVVTRLDTSRVSPLTRASRAGYLQIVRLLLDHGANPSAGVDSHEC